jgi:hypothetical protein
VRTTNVSDHDSEESLDPTGAALNWAESIAGRADSRSQASTVSTQVHTGTSIKHAAPIL